MEETKIQWHPAFCSAIQLELLDNRQELEFEQEYHLSSKPLQIDLLVVKKTADVTLSNPIGQTFRTYNILEYKSPKDELSIDDYFKVIAYGCLYKSAGKHVNGIPQEEITLTLVRQHPPRKLLQQLAAFGHSIEKPFPGIYYIRDAVYFPTQFLVGKELEEKAHIWLTSLTDELKQKQAARLIQNIQHLSGKESREKADSVLSLAIQANEAMFRQLREEDPIMREALVKLMEPEIQAAVASAHANGVQQGIEQGIEQGMAQGGLIMLYNMVKNKSITLPLAAQNASMSEGEFIEALKKIGYEL